MMSIENFYWILYEALLRPIDITCRYYYPFGTTANLSVDEYDVPKSEPRYNALALFHYDQEPIYSANDPALIDGIEGNYFKWPRLLANSEISDIKKQACKSHNLLDWYFFYHGFAALDWFRDAQYIEDNQKLTSAFCSLNHLVRNKRSYRMALIARMIQRNLVTKGQVSFHGDHMSCLQEITDPYTQLSDIDKQLIKKYIIDPEMSPLIFDRSDVQGSFSARLGCNEFRARRQSFLQVVNETIFYEKKLHLTEKIFQSVVISRPFILVSSPGSLAYFKSYGFKTFDKWIDEGYDLIANDHDRLTAIVEQIELISNRPLEELESMLEEMKPILEFNKSHFFGEFRKIIVDELVDNFDRCIRTWNTSRVDRVWSLHPDLENAKSLLLGKHIMGRNPT